MAHGMHLHIQLPIFWWGRKKIIKKLIFMLQCDLLHMPAVGQLEKDAKYALVYQLLEIFLTQRLKSYLEFHAANSTLLNNYGKMLFMLLKVINGCISKALS